MPLNGHYVIKFMPHRASKLFNWKIIALVRLFYASIEESKEGRASCWDFSWHATEPIFVLFIASIQEFFWLFHIYFYVIMRMFFCCWKISSTMKFNVLQIMTRRKFWTMCMSCIIFILSEPSRCKALKINIWSKCSYKKILSNDVINLFFFYDQQQEFDIKISRGTFFYFNMSYVLHVRGLLDYKKTFMLPFTIVIVILLCADYT